MRLVCLLTVILALALIAGCAKPPTPAPNDAPAPPVKEGEQGTDKPNNIKIGFIVKQPEEPWFQNEWKFAQQAADKYGFELVKIGAPDGEKVLAAIDNLAAGGAQGFIICTPDVRLGPAIVMRAKSHNLKLIAVDDQFVDADGKFMTDVHYLGISARKIGESVGRYLWDEMQKRKWPLEETAVCAVTFDELDTAKERTDGAIEALKKAGFPEQRIFRAPEKTTDVPGALDAVDILLTEHPEPKRWLVLAMNDNAVLGAVRALEGRGFGADRVIGIGINGTDCIVEFEKEKPTGFWGSILLEPKKHGFGTAEMMYKWIAEGTEPPLDTRTMGSLITRDNYKQVLKEQGLLDE
ncbi:MAG: arabinose ABC transporter substrate-binding protein [Armatimonadetes bacterium]|nr:arabinose ABC transporter substrate-binding protein [Armatimonadota bacterium]